MAWIFFHDLAFATLLAVLSFPSRFGFFVIGLTDNVRDRRRGFSPQARRVSLYFLSLP